MAIPAASMAKRQQQFQNMIKSKSRSSFKPAGSSFRPFGAKPKSRGKKK